MRISSLLGVFALGSLLTACGASRSVPASAASFRMGDAGAIDRARADSLRYPYTQADIDFMAGMIHHHAQAILISRWAPSHGASPAVQRLTARIINAQTDEIAIMQTWLRDRNQAPPTVDSTGAVSMPSAGGGHDAHAAHNAHAGHAAPAHDHTTMPGMLSPAQLAELDAARGQEFDRLFLTFMIAHHRGAVTMVRDLFSSAGAGQDETIFKFANDVEVDQSTEIKRMLSMMLEMGFPPPR
ncbi:MAG: DUF305 domain-containing protein [Gemmatimonadaceae bacterium]|jgi:uncharacterized protein (DUF305 family)|nr:DUF305 domain-containing protein [Gemmatimonadaceae bacterium]